MSETHGDEPPSLTPELDGKVRDTLEVWAAWQEPAFSFDTIQKDAWTAVYLPIPDNADPLLMTRAFSAASVCIDMIEQGHHGPRVPQGDGPDENIAKAQARMAELEPRAIAAINQNNSERIALAAGQESEKTPVPMTVEAIKRDPWNAVVLDLPENGSEELYAAVAETAQNLRFMPEAELPPMPFPAPANDLEWSTLGDEIKTRWKDAIGKAIDEAERREPTHSRWTGEQLGEAQTQSVGKGQSHR